MFADLPAPESGSPGHSSAVGQAASAPQRDRYVFGLQRFLRISPGTELRVLLFNTYLTNFEREGFHCGVPTDLNPGILS